MKSDYSDNSAPGGLVALYRALFPDAGEVEVEGLPASGSPRRYCRLRAPGAPSVIGCSSADVAENRTFVALAEALRAEGVAVPRVLAVNSAFDGYLQTDLGRTSLFDLIGDCPVEPGAGRRLRPDVAALVASSMREVARIHSIPSTSWENAVGFPPFGEELIAGDCEYFRSRFLLPVGAAFSGERLRRDFSRLKERLLATPRQLWGLMYRDFQSRNVMVADGRCVLIDFQSARFGPGLYDVASFLWQAKAMFGSDTRTSQVREYACGFAALRGDAGIAAMVEEFLPEFVLFRTLQVLGAYGFRGLVEGKRHFVESIPYALANFAALADDGTLDAYPELKGLSHELMEKRICSQ